MSQGVFPATVAREAVERGGLRAAGEGAIVTDIDPEPPGVGLALGQHRDRSVVAVQSLAAELIGERREAELDTLAGIAFGLPVQRLMPPARHCSRTNGEQRLALEEYRREQVRTGPTARRRMER